ncbi:MAG: signal recognition particle protein [Akkermansiaceae bacterium]
MFSNLADSLDKTFRNLRGVGKISEKNIADALREVRFSLLEADVELGVVKEFIANVSIKAQGTEVLKSIKPGEQIVKIFQDELTSLLGGDQAPINLNPPGYVLLCGLNGAGKTTTAAKLALRLKKEGRRPLLVACDLYRPAAIDQLAKLAGQVDVPCFTPDPSEKNLVKVAKQALKWAKTQDHTVVIFDTAGRQELDDNLIKELQELHKFLKPGETLLVADSATGQQAVSVAQTFDEKIGITGLILTKLDGDARGGAALSMRAVTGKPIKYIGEGEKMDDLAEFHPNRMADRILGMGDVVSMVEQVADKIDEEQAMKSAKRLQSGQFDFNDFLDQMKMIQSLGPLEGLMGMLPGFSKIKKQLPTGALDDKRIKHMEAIVLSMTPRERAKPIIIKPSRRRRLAAGSGTSLVQVNQLLKQFGMMQKMMKGKGGGKMKAMMDQMGGGMPGGGGGGGGGLGGLMKGMGGMKGLMGGGGNMPDMGSLEDLLGGKKGPKK